MVSARRGVLVNFANQTETGGAHSSQTIKPTFVCGELHAGSGGARRHKGKGTKKKGPVKRLARIVAEKVYQYLGSRSSYDSPRLTFS